MRHYVIFLRSSEMWHTVYISKHLFIHQSLYRHYMPDIILNVRDIKRNTWFLSIRWSLLHEFKMFFAFNQISFKSECLEREMIALSTSQNLQQLWENGGKIFDYRHGLRKQWCTSVDTDIAIWILWRNCLNRDENCRKSSLWETAKAPWQWMWPLYLRVSSWVVWRVLRGKLERNI